MFENTSKLFQLMKENPDLPVVPLVLIEHLYEDDGYYLESLGLSKVDEFLICGDSDYIAFKSEDNVFLTLQMYYSEEEFESLPESESECRKIYDSLPWVKAIIVYVDDFDEMDIYKNLK